MADASLEVLRRIDSSVRVLADAAEAQRGKPSEPIVEVASACFLLPSFLCSLYGMNVPLPYANQPGALWVILAVSVLWIAFVFNKLR